MYIYIYIYILHIKINMYVDMCEKLRDRKKMYSH